MSVSAIAEDFRKAGINGRLAPWEAPTLADRVVLRFPGANPDELVAAHTEGLRERARRAVTSRIASCSHLPSFDAAKLLETAAIAADLTSEELVAVVCELAPEAAAQEERDDMIADAEAALEDFQRAPARARFLARGAAARPPVEQLRERADNLSELRDAATRRARRVAKRIFDALPEGATIDDFAAALSLQEPLIAGRRAGEIAESEARSFSRPPTTQRGFAPGEDPFAETRTPPIDADYDRHLTALRILGTAPVGDLSNLRLAAFAGDAVFNPAAAATAEWKQRDLSDPAMWRDPANMPKELRGLSYIDFDPSLETPPPAWLAKGLLPRSGIGLLIGESGAGKSFAAVHAALSVAWGLPLFGAKVKQGAVLYIAAEGGRSVLRRIDAAERAMNGAIAAANICRPEGAPALSRATIRVVIEAPDLSRDGSPAPLVRTIRRAAEEFKAAGHRLALVIVDTWHAAMGGGEENSAADAGHALKPLIAEAEAGDFLGLLIHHPGKDIDRGARGSNALPAAADAIISISVPGFIGAVAKPSTAMRQAIVTKMRDGEAGGGFAYKLSIVPTGVDEDGDTVTTCVVEPCDPPKLDDDGLSRGGRACMKALQDALAEGDGKRGKFAEVRARFIASLPAELKSENKRQQWKRGLEAAEKAGLVEIDEQEFWIWPGDRN